MDNSEIILLKEGISPNVDLLSPIEEESILGGATKCDQGYRHSLFIGTKCDCGYDKFCNSVKNDEAYRENNILCQIP